MFQKDIGACAFAAGEGIRGLRDKCLYTDMGFSTAPHDAAPGASSMNEDDGVPNGACDDGLKMQETRSENIRSEPAETLK
jgi:hypothetical protein